MLESVIRADPLPSRIPTREKRPRSLGTGGVDVRLDDAVDSA
jgi:hypothetical protein